MSRGFHADAARIKPVLGPASMAVTAPEGRASVISGSLFRLGTRKSNMGWAVVRMPIAKIPIPTAKGLVLG